MSETESSFARLAKINVNEHIEKKGRFSYLSWTWALDQLMRADPDAAWEYPEAKLYGETMMIFCTVTAFGKARTAHLPVMDGGNKPISSPNAFQVNTAMQRCFVKAIALHGLGLYIYAGEDVPADTESDEPKRVQRNGPQGSYMAEQIPNGPITPSTGMWESLSLDMQNSLLDSAHRISSLLKKKDVAGAWDEFLSACTELDEVAKVGLWTRLDSAERSTLKKESERRKTEKAAA